MNFVRWNSIVVHAMRNRQHRLQSSTELNITFLNQQYKLTPFNGLTEEYMKMGNWRLSSFVFHPIIH